MGQILIKRFLSLTGKIPHPKFKNDLDKKVYLITYQLPKRVTASYVNDILVDYQHFLEGDELLECQKLKGIEKVFTYLTMYKKLETVVKGFLNRRGQIPSIINRNPSSRPERKCL